MTTKPVTLFLALESVNLLKDKIVAALDGRSELNEEELALVDNLHHWYTARQASLNFYKIHRTNHKEHDHGC